MVIDFAPQVFDVDVDRIGHGKWIEILSPDMFGQNNPGDRLAAVVEQESSRETLWE